MITKEKLLEVFCNAVDIIPFDNRDNSDSVFLGFISIREPEGLDAILSYYTTYIDNLLSLPLTPSQYLETITARVFTYSEYKQLWTVKPKDFQECMICKVLLIATEKERVLFTSVAKDDSHESFVQFLKVYTKMSNPFLYNFLYETYTECADK